MKGILRIEIPILMEKDESHPSGYKMTDTDYLKNDYRLGEWIGFLAKQNMIEIEIIQEETLQ